MSGIWDWFQLFGFISLFLGFLAAFYFALPGSREEVVYAKLSVGPTTAPNEAALIAEAEAHERHSPGHARRVADLALALADAAAFPIEQRDRLERAALLHDLGMREVPPDLIGRPGLLNQADWHQIWRHSAAGARKIQALSQDAAIAAWVRWAHERWDGLGYPDGLVGKQIPLPARILHLADSTEAMLSGRPYRPALAPEAVSIELNRLAGICYDPDLTRLLVDYVLPQRLQQS